jgi:hypothetical protein
VSLSSVVVAVSKSLVYPARHNQLDAAARKKHLLHATLVMSNPQDAAWRRRSPPRIIRTVVGIIYKTGQIDGWLSPKGRGESVITCNTDTTALNAAYNTWFVADTAVDQERKRHFDERCSYHILLPPYLRVAYFQ